MSKDRLDEIEVQNVRQVQGALRTDRVRETQRH
jgi:hypothetical protein